MSNDNRADFHKRLATLDSRPATAGRAKRSDRIGLYDQEEEKRRKRNRFPWRRLFITILIGIVGLIGIKAYTVHKMGEDAYQARLTELRTGESWEPYVAIAIGRDPLMMVFERLLFSKKPTPKTTNAPEPSSEAPENSN
jgi:hypothetical protein